MNRWTLGLAALVVAASTTVAMPAKAGTSVDVQIQVGDRYRGGEVTFRSEPDVVVVPSTRVYYVRDYNHDVYRYGSYWYFVDRDHWYRAHSWRGPFYHVRYSSVPRPICTVPVQYRRHWKQPGPPPHAVAKGYYKEKGAPNHYNHDHDRNARANSRDRDDDREAYNGNGNNGGHSHGKHGH